MEVGDSAPLSGARSQDAPEFVLVERKGGEGAWRTSLSFWVGGVVLPALGLPLFAPTHGAITFRPS